MDQPILSAGDVARQPVLLSWRTVSGTTLEECGVRAGTVLAAPIGGHRHYNHAQECL